MRSLYIFISAIVLIGCQQEDLTPSFLRIDSIELSTDGTTEGDNSHDIVDAWIYLDNAPLGVHEMPFVMPVLEEGEHQLTIFPGIKKNGISASRIIYPFYDRWEATVNFVKEDTLVITPVVSYKNNVEMALLEDFEDAGIDFVKYGESDTSIQFVDDPSIVKYGSKCGGISLNTEDSILLVKTISNLNLDRTNDCFIELDYMNNNTFGFGLIAYEGPVQLDQPILYIWNAQNNAEMQWKKIYINLWEEVSAPLNTTSAYGIYFLSRLDEENSFGNIYVDNIKIVKYQ